MLSLTKRDTEILQMLNWRVRLASLDQIARVWWSGKAAGRKSCSRRLGRLEKDGLLYRAYVTALVIPELNGPLAYWQPGTCVPDLGSLSWNLRRRWRREPLSQTIFFPTQKCSRYFGGKRRGRISRVFQVSHDLGTTEMFLAVRRSDRATAALWIDEDRLAPTRRGQKLPDAVIARDLDALPILVLEFGGNYSKSRLQAFHIDNESRGLAYQIW